MSYLVLYTPAENSIDICILYTHGLLKYHHAFCDEPDLNNRYYYSYMYVSSDHLITCTLPVRGVIKCETV